MRLAAALVLLVLAAAASALSAGAARAAASRSEPGPPDPLFALVHRMDTFLHEAELEGITLDPRFHASPAEFTRLSVVCQLLGYLELERSMPTTRTHRLDIRERAEFLIAHFDEITGGTATDGMLAYALLGAFEETGDERYRERANVILESVKQLEGYSIALNWGLMAGMALARSHRQTGDPAALEKLDQILERLEWSRSDDGSFPHVCAGSPDVHYSGWMAMELFAIARELDDPGIRARALRTAAFLAARVKPGGEIDYWGPCATCPNLLATYWSHGAGCIEDYDTRAWTNELGYIALALDEADDPRYETVMRFLAAHEDRGAFPDKWAYLPPESDPTYPWASEPRSVVRTSILFWTLSMILAERAHPAAAGGRRATRATAAATPDLAGGVQGRQLRWDAATATLHFGLEPAASADLSIRDVRGRRVRVLLDDVACGEGERAIAWDGRDDHGRAVAPGVYFARLVTDGRRATARLPVFPTRIPR